MNHVQLTALIAELGALRYTPSGLPALDLWLEHESEQEEAGRSRLVQARVRAVAFAAVAERLKGVPLGSRLSCTGFLVTPRTRTGAGRSVVLHIQQFQQD